MSSPSYGHIVLPAPLRREVLDHCRRKLAASFVSGEPSERKAYGLLAGTVAGDRARVEAVRPLLRNARGEGHFKTLMDRAMREYAVASETPLAKRGWVADPAELFGAIREFQGRGWILLGTYHMHRVGWEHDPLRDTPTELDHRLAVGSGLAMAIVSMVDPQHPILRVFWEGDPAREIPVLTGEEP